MSKNPLISIIVPVLNEQGSLEIFYRETSNALKGFPDWEIIFIDDGSDDDSNKIIRRLSDDYKRITLIQFFKNFGKADALSEGFSYAKGDIVITIDSDLQDDPAEIPRLIEKVQEGWDVVSGWKKDRKDPASKKIPSKGSEIYVFYRDSNYGLGKIIKIKITRRNYNDDFIFTII